MLDLCWVLYVIVVMVVVDGGCVLLVEEIIEGCQVLNQLVGYFELGESLVEVVLCEIWEEIGWIVQLIYFIGCYQWIVGDGIVFLCFCYVVCLFLYDLV